MAGNGSGRAATYAYLVAGMALFGSATPVSRLVGEPFPAMLAALGCLLGPPDPETFVCHGVVTVACGWRRTRCGVWRRGRASASAYVSPVESRRRPGPASDSADRTGHWRRSLHSAAPAVPVRKRPGLRQDQDRAGDRTAAEASWRRLPTPWSVRVGSPRPQRTVNTAWGASSCATHAAEAHSRRVPVSCSCYRGHRISRSTRMLYWIGRMA
jgi:hypothetical protein